MDARFAALSDCTRERFPAFGEPTFRWSGQVLEPMDFMPFSGRNPGDRRIFVHSGDSGQGITNGVAGALTIAPLVADAPARYADLFDPSRKPFTARPSLANFIESQVGAVRNFAEYATPGEIPSENELEPGCGAILRDGAPNLAVYRRPAGAVSRRRPEGGRGGKKGGS